MEIDLRVLHQDRKTKKIKLLIETIDDLWHLDNIVDENNLVFSLTHRREEVKKDKIRAERAEKKPMFLGIRVEKLEFHEFSDRLRIHGIIEVGPQDLGSYHTLNITVGDKITIVKDWRSHDLDRIKEAVDASKTQIVTFLSIDDENATIALLRHYGIQHIATILSHASGKLYKSGKNEKKDYFSQVLNKLEQVKEADSPLIIIGPGFTKDEFYEFGKNANRNLFQKCIIENTGQSGMTAINEALKRKIVSKIVEKCRIEFETQLVEDVLSQIAIGKLVAYGYVEVENALSHGAVEHFLITNMLVRTKKGEWYLRKAKRIGAKITIISNLHEAGKKLDSLGGVASLLRFDL